MRPDPPWAPTSAPFQPLDGYRSTNRFAVMAPLAGSGTVPFTLPDAAAHVLRGARERPRLRLAARCQHDGHDGAAGRRRQGAGVGMAKRRVVGHGVSWQPGTAGARRRLSTVGRRPPAVGRPAAPHRDPGLAAASACPAETGRLCARHETLRFGQRSCDMANRPDTTTLEEAVSCMTPRDLPPKARGPRARWPARWRRRPGRPRSRTPEAALSRERRDHRGAAGRRPARAGHMLRGLRAVGVVASTTWRT